MATYVTRDGAIATVTTIAILRMVFSSGLISGTGSGHKNGTAAVAAREAAVARLVSPAAATIAFRCGRAATPRLYNVLIHASRLKKRAAELCFQLADRDGQSWLRDRAPPRRASEIALLAQSQKISNLLHLH